MNPDLVERLRQEGEDAMRKHLSMGMWQLCSEAADRIEQLEDDLQDCQSRAITQRGDLRYRIEQLEEALRHVEAIMAIVPPRTAKGEYLAALDAVRKALGAQP